MSMTTTAVSCVGPRRPEAKQGEGETVTLEPLVIIADAVADKLIGLIAMSRKLGMVIPTDEEIFGEGNGNEHSEIGA